MNLLVNCGKLEGGERANPEVFQLEFGVLFG
jgi:hypothetical protein